MTTKTRREADADSRALTRDAGEATAKMVDALIQSLKADAPALVQSAMRGLKSGALRFRVAFEYDTEGLAAVTVTAIDSTGREHPVCDVDFAPPTNVVH